MIHTCLSPLIDQREVSHVILAQGAAVTRVTAVGSMSRVADDLGWVEQT